LRHGVYTDLAEVIGGAAAAGDERYDSVTLEKLLEVTLYGVDERLVRRDLQLTVEKRLHHHHHHHHRAYKSWRRQA